MHRVKQNHLKFSSKQEFKFIRYLTHASKNLYNSALFVVRHNFFKTGHAMSHHDLYNLMQDKPVFRALPTDPANLVIFAVEESWKVYFALLKLKNQGKYDRPVSIPGYLPKDGYFSLTFPIRKGRCKTQFTLRVPKNLQPKFGIKDIKVPRPQYIDHKVLKEVRITPRSKGDYYDIAWTYEEHKIETQMDPNRVLAVDIGVNNFATLLDNQSGRPLILDGRELKSYNRFYNKRVAQKRPGSKNKLRMGNKRRRKFNDALNQYCNFILQYCLHTKTSHVFVGEGWLAQEGANLGKVSNQNFVFIPFGKFFHKLQSLLARYGIKCDRLNEAYTSKCDHLAGEEMCHHEKYLGRRVHRGLFKSSTGVLLNADVNGALGQLLKSTHDASLVVERLVDRGCLTQPRRVFLDDIRERSSINLVREMVPD